MNTIFEAVDITSDETYFTVGLWLSRDEAVAALLSCGENPPGDEEEDCCIVEIRERKVGMIAWSETGKAVWRIRWVKRYDENSDAYKMEITSEAIR